MGHFGIRVKNQEKYLWFPITAYSMKQVIRRGI